MMLGNKELLTSIFDHSEDIRNDTLVVVPRPDKNAMLQDGGASLDLRLGRWFRTMKRSNTSLIDMHEILAGEKKDQTETKLTKEAFVQFGEKFILHPGQFVLAVTLEWIRLPVGLVGHITGKSSLGRRGLIIETAAGVQPGFTGCVTLELANVGEVPIGLVPAMKVCQIFFSRLETPADVARSKFTGRRKPGLGSLSYDPMVVALKNHD
jgi:dCTP deaminase